MIEWYLDLLHQFLNHRWSLQSDGLSAVRFVHESLLSFRSKSHRFLSLKRATPKQNSQSATVQQPSLAVERAWS